MTSVQLQVLGRMPPKKAPTPKGPKGAVNKRKPRRTPLAQKRSPAQRKQDNQRNRDYTKMIDSIYVVARCPPVI